jgi:sterol desaturase/sphingolipid hydroxylase (fatty acid hydroxylase superfamily)
VNSTFAIDFEPAIRIGAFLVAFIAVALWEVLAPRGLLTRPRGVRWKHNIALLAVDVLVLRVVAPGAAIGLAVVAQSREWGLLNILHAPAWIAFPVGLLILDLAIYLQHVAFHTVGPLWRLHRVHHADRDVDVTTGTRFHPLEILISTAIKCAVVSAVGVPVLAVLAFEVLLNAAAMFNHANASIPTKLERWLRYVVVTPDMHRIHHSIKPNERDRNFGFNLPWWDYLFRTHRRLPRISQSSLIVGVEGLGAVEEQRLDRMLLQPFRSDTEPPAGARIAR